MWELRQYRQVVSDFIAQCDEDMQAAIFDHLEALREQGSNARYPLSEKMIGTDGIFECRPRAGKRASRLLYFFQPGKKIIFVVAVSKDQRKLNKKEIEKAERRKKSIIDGSEEAHGYHYTH